jgi:hypothetical protein
MRATLVLFTCLLAGFVQDGGRPAPPTLPEVGKPAPAIRLNDHTGKVARIGGEAAHWSVLAFFPKAATPG